VHVVPWVASKYLNVEAHTILLHKAPDYIVASKYLNVEAHTILLHKAPDYIGAY